MEPDVLVRRRLSQSGIEQEIHPQIEFSEINKAACTVSSHEHLDQELQMVPKSDVNQFHSYAKIQKSVPVIEETLVSQSHNQFMTTALPGATSLALFTGLSNSTEEVITDALIGTPIIDIPGSDDLACNFGNAGSNDVCVGIQINNTAAYQSVLENVITAGQVELVASVDTATKSQTGKKLNELVENNSVVSSDDLPGLSVSSMYTSDSSNSLDVLCNVQLMTFSSDNHKPRIKLVRVTNAIVLSVQFICKVCGKDYPSADTLGMHAKSHTLEAQNPIAHPEVSKVDEGTTVFIEAPLQPKIQDLLSSNMGNQVISPISGNVPSIHRQVVGKNTEENTGNSTNYNGREGECPIYNQGCFICKNMFNTTEFWHHYCRVHMEDDSNVQCFICGKQLENQKDLFQHMMKLHARLKDPAPFCCAVCDKRFDSETFLLNHMLRDHRASEGADNPPTLPIGRKTASKSPGSTEKAVKLSCAQCEGTGVVSSRRNPCRICGKLFSDSRQLIRHLSEHSEQTLCTVCHKVIYLKSLPKHMTLHTKPKAFECPQCNKAYRDKCDLTKHMRIHTGEKPYTCEICHKSFTHSSQLPRHLRTHTGEKPFKCDICNKVFSRRFGLQQHMSCHYSDKLFKCFHCSKEFRNQKALQKHTLKHLPVTPS